MHRAVMSSSQAPAWVEPGRGGKTVFPAIEPRVYGMFDLSDDGRLLAIQVSENMDYILIYDIARNASRRLPAPDSAGWPKWSPGSGSAQVYQLSCRQAVPASGPGRWIRTVRQSSWPKRQTRLHTEHDGVPTDSASRITSFRKTACGACASVPRDGATAPPPSFSNL